jgi:hypothetical protein
MDLREKKTCSITLREKERLTIFKDVMMWKIFGPQTEEIGENWRKMSKEELHGLYTSVNTLIKSKEKR